MNLLSYSIKLATFWLCLQWSFSSNAIVVSAESDEKPLVTRWASQVSHEVPWPEYPRPQLVRDRWLNLNGMWELSITESADSLPEAFAEKILVPFPLESYLGGLRKSFLPSQRAWYRRTFNVDRSWANQSILLHFGAVDWDAQVWVNGKRLGEHRGGYDPFTLDISEAIDWERENVLIVAVEDPTDSAEQPRGKQKLAPEGIWYTPISGIWQTVWLEPVPHCHVRKLDFAPNCQSSTVTVTADIGNAQDGHKVVVQILNGENTVASASTKPGKPVSLKIVEPRLWCPSDPFLYDIRVQIVQGGKTVDSVASYFGMRSIKLGTDHNGMTRIMFNDQPLFQYGPLDQGYWPDGLYTAPTDQALRYDLEVIKRLGFNMVRKHVKVEPARWYYWCDRLGLLVWQDMPSGDKHAPWPSDGREIQRTAESAAQYRHELKAIVDTLRNHPSIVVWIPFNEAWGQFDTVGVTEWLEKYDPNRLVISASGGNDFGCGHIKDDHFYPGPGTPPAETHRAAVLGEFGGFGLPLSGHTWQLEKNWGYRSFESSEQLAVAYKDAISKLRPLVESHLSAAVYTQITDVEIEVNGLMTYDRQIIKVDENQIRAAHEQLYKPLPESSGAEIVAASVLAWWRFEDGTVGEALSDLNAQMGAIAARDYSGHNNHLFAFSAGTSPSTSNKVPVRPFNLIKAENKHSLNDTASPGGGVLTRDLYTNPDIARTHMDHIDRYPLADFTIEASYCLSQSEGNQTVLAKELDRAGTFIPLFQLGVFGDPPVIGVELVDNAENNVQIYSDVQPQPNEWWHVAVTCDDGTARIYIASDQLDEPYKLAGQTTIKGSLVRQGGTWLVGRGSEAGRMGRDFFGWIDEVRVSTKALAIGQFLFSNSQSVATQQESE